MFSHPRFGIASKKSIKIRTFAINIKFNPGLHLKGLKNNVSQKPNCQRVLEYINHFYPIISIPFVNQIFIRLYMLLLCYWLNNQDITILVIMGGDSFIRLDQFCIFWKYTGWDLCFKKTSERHPSEFPIGFLVSHFRSRLRISCSILPPRN